jgi:hypothetical protein
MNSIQLRDKVALAMLDVILRNPRTHIKKPEEYLAKLIEQQYKNLHK